MAGGGGTKKTIGFPPTARLNMVRLVCTRDAVSKDGRTPFSLSFPSLLLPLSLSLSLSFSWCQGISALNSIVFLFIYWQTFVLKKLLLNLFREMCWLHGGGLLFSYYSERETEREREGERGRVRGREGERKREMVIRGGGGRAGWRETSGGRFYLLNFLLILPGSWQLLAEGKYGSYLERSPCFKCLTLFVAFVDCLHSLAG